MTFQVSHWPDPDNPDADYTTTHESLSAALDSIDPTIGVEWDRAGCALPEGRVYMRVLGVYIIQVWVEALEFRTEDEEKVPMPGGYLDIGPHVSGCVHVGRRPMEHAVDGSTDLRQRLRCARNVESHVESTVRKVGSSAS